MAEAVLITGVSAGFGKAMAETFVKEGYRVIGAARRLEKLNNLKRALGENFYPLQMDMTDTASIDKALASLPQEWSEIELLINNAGLALGLDKAYEANFKDWETMIATNIIGLTYLTRQVLPAMAERKSGHVINIGSTAGTYPYPGGNVYGASKAFVKQFSLNLRADLAGTKVRVTNIEPGLCGGTEFSNVRFKGDDERADHLYRGAHSIQPQDIANTVLWVYQQPKHVNINRVEIMPTSQSFGPQPVDRDLD
ncbi:SDR family oxidoreductase [Streptococcus ratti]|uniref:Oxidoreductase, short-chain dehydrogenase/reductase n=1 Tax=Streptococcus ratti FA-1 = DSM 20564 TaxID=699248 RepID=A0ABP2QZZ7_STRRT|nr:SDR family oxidoreductase [Streptococcus ratti]EJN93872.1 putative oxidoreductase, short-chain dehydrogenase/reductase [Streptococcus ratti FA-1 = DSM 20564]EMP71111.1 oxidoreductase [Streptococcus ratti FA-1 = DSM 20564]QEY07720.1 SDR family oxidoreductase [Streptococcus ratti]VEI60181.1 oxidoreductase [Streptococcus mutans]